MYRAILAATLFVLAVLGWRAFHRAPPAPQPTPAPPVAELQIVETPESIIVLGPGDIVRVAPRARKPAPGKPPVPEVARKAIVPRAATPPRWTITNYTCADARYYNARFSRETLETMRVAAGKPKPTADEMRQIRACINQPE